MKIKEIRWGMSGITIEGKVIEKSEARRVRTRYGSRSVAHRKLTYNCTDPKNWLKKISRIVRGSRAF